MKCASAAFMSPVRKELLLLMVFVLAVAGCGNLDTQSEIIPLLDPFNLTPVHMEADPLVTHRPAEVDCPAATWGPEGGGFEIQTGACNYGAFDQSLSTPLKAGDTLNILIWHDMLDFSESAVAHVAIWAGTQILWEADVDIPGPSGSFEVAAAIEDTPAPDARLGLHLHNHGFNSWRFVTIDLHRPR